MEILEKKLNKCSGLQIIETIVLAGISINYVEIKILEIIFFPEQSFCESLDSTNFPTLGTSPCDVTITYIRKIFPSLLFYRMILIKIDKCENWGLVLS